MQMVSTWQAQTHTVTGFDAKEQQELTDCHNSACRTSEWSVNRRFYANATQCTERVALLVKNPPANAEDVRDVGSIPWPERPPGGGHGNPLQYSCMENPMDRGA
ncbi:unnamed protein product [Rangifer tarandus platyrhynchus]|uniref:Uncharacterized protein n=2 Tax=Rangifer tarandus platyrhynchus TaxID=3082113 RepID=A0ABN8ZR57_RANTA|nr:unnamed protein product [Rangifer tarandus platyrhynchus]